MSLTGSYYACFLSHCLTTSHIFYCSSTLRIPREFISVPREVSPLISLVFTFEILRKPVLFKLKIALYIPPDFKADCHIALLIKESEKFNKRKGYLYLSFSDSNITCFPPSLLLAWVSLAPEARQFRFVFLLTHLSEEIKHYTK